MGRGHHVNHFCEGKTSGHVAPEDAFACVAREDIRQGRYNASWRGLMTRSKPKDSETTFARDPPRQAPGHCQGVPKAWPTEPSTFTSCSAACGEERKDTRGFIAVAEDERCWPAVGFLARGHNNVPFRRLDEDPPAADEEDQVHDLRARKNEISRDQT